MFRCPIDGTSSAAVAVCLEVRQLVGAVAAGVVLVVGEPFIVRHRQQTVILSPGVRAAIMSHHVAGIVPREILACVGHRVIHIGQGVPLPAVIISSVVICDSHLCWRHGQGKHILSRDTPVFMVCHPHRVHQIEMVGIAPSEIVVIMNLLPVRVGHLLYSVPTVVLVLHLDIYIIFLLKGMNDP